MALHCSAPQPHAGQMPASTFAASDPGAGRNLMGTACKGTSVCIFPDLPYFCYQQAKILTALRKLLMSTPMQTVARPWLLYPFHLLCQITEDHQQFILTTACRLTGNSAYLTQIFYSTQALDLQPSIQLAAYFCTFSCRQGQQDLGRETGQRDTVSS